MKIKIQHDLKKFEKDISRLFRKQIPYAASRALNDTAFDVRKNTIEKVWPQAVDVKAKGFARSAFRVKTSDKYNLEAAVYARFGDEIFDRNIKGRVHIPYGRHLAVPMDDALTPTGRIKRAARINDPSLFKAKMGNTLGLWRRTRKGLQLMYVLKPRVPTPRAFRFYEEAENTVRRRFPRHFRRRFRQALRTAR